MIDWMGCIIDDLSLLQVEEEGYWEEDLDFEGLEDKEWGASASLVGAMGRMELDEKEEGVEGVGGGRRKGRREEFLGSVPEVYNVHL